MFMKGQSCELRALEESEYEAESFTKAVNAGLTTEHMLTGSYPMRVIDCLAAWRKEREAGSVQFGIWAEMQVDGPMYPKALCFIGTCGLHAHRDIYRSWEFRILIFDPSAVGHGIGTEATRLVVDYAFKRLNAHRVWLGANAANVRAIKCYEKVGFVREGVLREDLFTHGRYRDAVRMGVLEQEWTSSSQAQA